MQTKETAVAARPKLWSFVFVRIGIITSLSGVCTQMFMSAFPQYLQQNGFSATQMGLVASGYTVSAMIMRVFAGNLIDKRGRRNMCLLGLLLFGAPICGFYFSSAAALLVILRLSQGFGSSLFGIATGTMAPDVLPKERMGEGIGYYGLFNSLATAIGPAVGVALLIGGRSDVFFIFGFIMILAAAAVTLSVNYEKKQVKISEKKDETAAIGSSPEEQQAEAEALEDEKRCFVWKFFDKKAIPASIVAMLVTCSTTTITNFVSPYGISEGITAIGSFFTVQAVFMIFARVSSTKIAARIGVFRTVLLGLALDVVAMTLLAIMRENTAMFLAAAIRGLGGGFYFPLLNTLAVQNAAKSRRGKATSTYYASYDIGAGIGAAFWGFISDHFGGYRTVYAGAALFYIVTISSAYVCLGRNKQNSQIG